MLRWYSWAMGFFGWIRFVLTIAIAIGVFIAAALALIDAVRKPAVAYTDGGKKTKKFWLLVLGAGGLFALLGAVGMINIMLNIIAIVPAAVYWYDVRPAIHHPTQARPAALRSPGPNFMPTRRRRPVSNITYDTRPAGKASDPRFD